MVKAVLLDIDGILTDGAVYVDSSGNETKRIAFDDIDAIFEMKRAGLKIGFITGEDSEFCKYVQKRFAPDFFATGCKDKVSACKEFMKEAGMKPEHVCYAGDSRKDMPLLEFLPLTFVPADVDQCIKDAAKVVLKKTRGNGVIREVAEHVLAGNRSSAMTGQG